MKLEAYNILGFDKEGEVTKKFVVDLSLLKRFEPNKKVASIIKSANHFEEKEQNLREIYQLINECHPFCKTVNIRSFAHSEAVAHMSSEGYSFITSYFPNSCYDSEDAFMVFMKGDFMVAMDMGRESGTLLFLYDHFNTKHLDEIEKLKLFKRVIEGSRVSLLTREYGELSLHPCALPVQELDFDNYNEDFERAHSKMVEFLATDDEPQLSLLFGLPGTGKSRYLRSLGSFTKKEIVYVTKDLIDAFCSPDFLAFAIRELKNKVLVCEDVDAALINDGARSTATSNLLNLSSGCLAAILQTKIICTYNITDHSMIDPALLRKGRLGFRYEMKALEKDRANALLKKLGKTQVAAAPMTLADVYNVGEDNGGEVKVDRMGF